MNDLYCPLRRSWCKALPEEAVRIDLINYMITQLAFPPETLAVEKELRCLPHLASEGAIPDRRADILCFAKGIHPSTDLYPLLMIECKAVKITDKVIAQVVGYNHYVKACFVCVANMDEIRTGWRNAEGAYDFVPYMPSYIDLKRSVANTGGHR